MQRNPNEFELVQSPFFNPNLLPGADMSAEIDVSLKTEESKS